MLYMRIIILKFILFCLVASLTAQVKHKIFDQTRLPYNPEKYVCYKASEKITIDGKLTENSWTDAQWTNYFVDIEGDLKPAPLYNTRAKMLWDDSCFYFAAHLDEPNLWARLKQRDTVIFRDNDFEIFIDPDGDTHGYYEYETNAYATEWDLFLTKPYRDGACALDGFNYPGLRTAVTVQGTVNNPADTDTSWIVEVAIPWKTFKDCADTPLPPLDGDQWRVNFSRVEWQLDKTTSGYTKKINPETNRSYPEYNWVWSAQGLIAMHAPETWGIVQFCMENPGNSVVHFNLKKDEEARWALRKLYYNQRTYHLNNSCYTTNLNTLGLKDVSLVNYGWPPEVYITPTLFEAVLRSNDKMEEWHITQDGKIWNELETQ